MKITLKTKGPLLISITLFITMLCSCSSAPNIQDTEAVDKYLQSHTFSNSTAGKVSFSEGSYQLHSTGDNTQIYILRGGSYSEACEEHDWWYLNKNGSVYNQIQDELVCYTID